MPISSSVANNDIFLIINILFIKLLELLATLYSEEVCHILEILRIKAAGTMPATGNRDEGGFTCSIIESSFQVNALAMRYH
ncbi:MAG TPA: hypothetical protein DDW70_03940, partial [Rikenellaceae bacterium]|nr:hypothetical protein [Rikenellaceae bacterium]